MLADLDQSVAEFLGRMLPDGASVRFDPPATSWVSEPPDPPFLDAFLYDIREAQPPASDGTLTTDPDGRADGWQPPVRRYRVSYLLTAWTDDGLREHELLGAVLVGCAAAYSLPADCLRGTLAEMAEPLPVACAGSTPACEHALIWPRLAAPARTALDLRVVAPVIPPLATDLAPGVRSLSLVAHGRHHEAAAGARQARPTHRITEP